MFSNRNANVFGYSFDTTKKKQQQQQFLVGNFLLVAENSEYVRFEKYFPIEMETIVFV